MGHLVLLYTPTVSCTVHSSGTGCYIMIQKNKVVRAYNKRVRRKSFEEGELVWKVVLPIDAKDRELGK